VASRVPARRVARSPMSATPAPISAEQMRLVLDVSRMLSVTADLDPLLKHITESVAALLNCDRASIFLHEPTTDELWTKVALGLGGGQQIRIPAGAGIVGAAFKANQLLHVPKPYEDPRFNPTNDRKTGFLTRNICSAPMVDLQRQPVGVIQAINKRGEGADFTDNDKAMLQLLSEQAGVAIQRFHLQRGAIESMALRKELDLAKKVQEAMIPKTRPDVPGLDPAGWTKAASVNGGDCFDLWKLPDGRLGILLADASGHGIAPALVVMQARTLVRTLSDTELDPLKLLVRINGRLSEDMVAGRFVTVFLGFLAPDGWLEWSSCGHGPILLRPAPGEPVQSLEPGLPPIGILDDMMEEASPPVRLEPGGTLVVTSDGITESFAPDGQLFGETRLVETLDACEAERGTACRESRDVVTAIHRAAIAWQGGKDEPKDDQTVVVVRRVD
jgi:sigma-B regulation protein RsbU (phosphoserine phosphatase)